MGAIPPVFVSHGAPTLATDAERGAELAQWARDLPRPRGILAVSALWSEPVLTRGTTSRVVPALRDFDVWARRRGDGAPLLEGFGDALAQVDYAAPGAPDLAYELHTLLPVERSSRGLDHGTWSTLLHMYPEADVPVLPISLVTGASPRRLFGIGRKLGVLADRGYLVLGVGGFTRNLEELDPRRDAPPADFARAFDAWAANLLADAEIDELLAWRARGPEARRANPTPEHMDALFVVAGAASLRDHAVGFPVRGFEHGTLSRRCVQFGR